MRHRSWPILVPAFGVLVFLIAILGAGAMRSSHRIYDQISTLDETRGLADAALHELRSGIYTRSLLVRDFLLDPSAASAERYRGELHKIRLAMDQELDGLDRLLAPREAARLGVLRRELDTYWTEVEPLFTWSPSQRNKVSGWYLRNEVLPGRQRSLSIADEIRELTRVNLRKQRDQIDRRQRELPGRLGRMLAITLLLGSLVAAASVFRITRLEYRAAGERRRTELAESELRRLSQQLVKAQEEERKSLSRELHDEIGQMLTALRMELHSIQELRNGPEEQFNEHLEDSRQLSEQALRAVRDIAMGLRPSMLDDLGLGSAIQWQAREFSRHCGVPVTVHVEGVGKNLPEHHRTCIYRVAQEALTNCARHARASEIRITLRGDAEWLALKVEDNGAGFDPAEARGLGLMGIEERVRELGGEIDIFSQPGMGTVLSARVPFEKEKIVA